MYDARYPPGLIANLTPVAPSTGPRMTHRLFLAPTTPAFAALYKTAADAYNRTKLEERSSGFDLFSDGGDQDWTYSEHATLVGQGCRAVALGPANHPVGYWLAPRSSISKTPYRLANSLGLIDPTYRGIIKAAFSGHVVIESNQRLCQLVPADLVPWLDVVVVDELPVVATLRGEGGFGSTGL